MYVQLAVSEFPAEGVDVDIGDTDEEAKYRLLVRDYLVRNSAQLVRVGGPPKNEAVAAYKRTQAILYDGGLVGITWPRKYGGQGGKPIQQVIVNQELGAAAVPDLINSIGVGMCGPTLIAHGTEAQKERYLRPLLRADEVWCQLFSEPGAGSDLAGVSTRAARTDEGAWRLTGQKVWTSGAQFSDFGILLARTDPGAPKHSGLTMFALDMQLPGITVRPLLQMNGDAEFSEVFLENVQLPDSARIGSVDEGWAVAITTLMSERLAVGGDGGTLFGASLDTLLGLAASAISGLPEWRQAWLRQEIATCWIEATACRYTGYRRLTQLSREQVPGPEASAGKLAAAHVARRIADLGTRLQGDGAVCGANAAGDGFWQSLQAWMPAATIAGGSDEVLKNIIGERVLGLPAEPRLDKAGFARASIDGGR